MSSVTRSAAQAMMAALAAATLRPAQAAPLPAPEQSVTYAVVDQDLRDVITEVAQQSRLRANVSEAVRGRVRGRLPSATLAGFLDYLAATYGLDWYYDGSAVYVSSAAEAASKMLPLGSVALPQLARDLDALGISDPRWPLRGAADAKVVILDGPPRYVKLVEQTLDALSQQRSQPSAAVSVFRGSVSR